MAKAKISKEKQLEKSLKAAAKILNKKLHKSAFSKILNDNIAGDTPEPITPMVTLYQVWCPDTEEVIGSPTTDEDAAIILRDRHNEDEGHNATIIESN